MATLPMFVTMPPAINVDKYELPPDPPTFRLVMVTTPPLIARPSAPIALNPEVPLLRLMETVPRLFVPPLMTSTALCETLPLPGFTPVLLARSVPPLLVMLPKLPGVEPLLEPLVPHPIHKDPLMFRELPVDNVTAELEQNPTLPVTFATPPELMKNFPVPLGFNIVIPVLLKPFALTFRTPLFVSPPNPAAAIGRL